MSEHPPEIGFIGLGSMGGAIAQRLAASGSLAVFDVNPAAADALTSAAPGVVAVPLADLGRTCRVVFTCLPKSENVVELLTEHGLLDVLQPGSVLVDMTTGSPAVDARIRELLRERGVEFADAPVSGGPTGAQKGTLCIMVGADPDVFERIAPVMRTISSNVVHVGPPSSGHVMKLVNNFLALANRLAASEGVAMAVRHGIELNTCLDVLEMSTGASYTTSTTFRRMATEGKAAAQGFQLGLAAKDVRLARALFDDADIPSWVAEQTSEVLDQAEQELGGDQDVAAIQSWYGYFGLPPDGLPAATAPGERGTARNSAIR
jgi:3-hydroxyisobutyrate dehydrogenase-like beta-hydroxyacid dehydrogenase